MHASYSRSQKHAALAQAVFLVTLADRVSKLPSKAIKIRSLTASFSTSLLNIINLPVKQVRYVKPTNHRRHEPTMYLSNYFSFRSFCFLGKYKAPTTPQSIAHEICGPTLAFFAFPSLVQFQRAINAIDSLVVPTMTQPMQAFEQLAEYLFWSLPGQFQQQFVSPCKGRKACFQNFLV